MHTQYTTHYLFTIFANTIKENKISTQIFKQSNNMNIQVDNSNYSRLNRKNLIISLLLLIVIISYATILFIINENIFASTIIIALASTWLIVFNVKNHIKNNAFNKQINILSKQFKNLEMWNEVIWIKKQAYDLKVFKQSNNVKIRTDFEEAKAIICLTDNFLVLYIQIKEFVLFTKTLEPITLHYKSINEVDSINIKIQNTTVIIKSSKFPKEIAEIKLNLTDKIKATIQTSAIPNLYL